MRIVLVKLFSFSLSLKKDILIGTNAITERAGIIIELTDENQNRGYGETSPFPFYSDESLKQAKEELFLVSESLSNLSVTSVDEIFDFTKESKLSGSVCFGIESALLDILSHALNKTTEQLLSENYLREIPINALLSGTKEQIIERAALLKGSNYKSIKIKVGSLSVAEATEITSQVSEVLSDKVSIRLDFNQSWRLKDVIQLYDNLKDLPVEYLEEPLADISETKQLDKHQLKIPLALDEKLRNLSPNEIVSFKHLKAVILKPTVLGLARSLEFAKIAGEQNIMSVISSTFESQVGIVMLARVASCLNQNECAMGLDTTNVFTESLLTGPFNVLGEKIVIDNLPEVAKSMNKKMLKEIKICASG